MQSSRRLWDGNRAPCSQLLLPLPPTTCCKQQSSKHLQQETEESLQLGFAALPKTYKLLDFLIVVSRLLSEVVGAAHHCCCYLVYGIPLCIQVGIYTTTLLVWIFFFVLSNLIAIIAVVGRIREVQIYFIVNIKRIRCNLSE